MQVQQKLNEKKEYVVGIDIGTGKAAFLKKIKMNALSFLNMLPLKFCREIIIFVQFVIFVEAFFMLIILNVGLRFLS